MPLCYGSCSKPGQTFNNKLSDYSVVKQLPNYIFNNSVTVLYL
jgi:hypothetical protein